MAVALLMTDRTVTQATMLLDMQLSALAQLPDTDRQHRHRSEVGPTAGGGSGFPHRLPKSCAVPVTAAPRGGTVDAPALARLILCRLRLVAAETAAPANDERLPPVQHAPLHVCSLLYLPPASRWRRRPGRVDHNTLEPAAGACKPHSGRYVTAH